MNTGKSINIAFWAEKSEKLLERIRRTYFELGIKNYSLPDHAFDRNNPVSLVFAGQYNAGKSTILKALTGFDDIVIKDGIATQETHAYEWNGMTVIDTPGIGTKLRPDHDEIALKAISQSDMLIYVVTHNLFDDLIGNEFRNLIIANDKAKETILIVNKMAEIGNNEETQTIKTEALREVTDPYSPEELRTCFVDAESYIDSKVESDEEISEALLERSNYSVLIDTINRFVAEKALTVRLTTSLYKTIDSLQTTAKEFLPSSGDDDIDALEETLLRQKSILVKTIRSIESEVSAKYKTASEETRDVGRRLADSLDTFSSQAEIDDEFNSAQNEVDEISARCSGEIEKSINDILSQYDEDMDEFYSSPFTKKLYQRLEKKNINDMPVIKKIVDTGILKSSGSAIAQNAGGIDKGLKGLGGFSGTNVHKIVLDVGHFFGHSFKPWEAVKITKGINVAGKILGIAGTVLSIFMQAKEDYDAEERVKDQREAREQIRAAYNTTAAELEKHYADSLTNMIDNALRPKLDELEESIRGIRELRIGKSEKCQQLLQLEKECRKLIGEIHSSEIH